MKKTISLLLIAVLLLSCLAACGDKKEETPVSPSSDTDADDTSVSPKDETDGKDVFILPLKAMIDSAEDKDIIGLSFLNGKANFGDKVEAKDLIGESEFRISSELLFHGYDEFAAYDQAVAYDADIEGSQWDFKLYGADFGGFGYLEYYYFTKGGNEHPVDVLTKDFIDGDLWLLDGGYPSISGIFDVTFEDDASSEYRENAIKAILDKFGKPTAVYCDDEDGRSMFSNGVPYIDSDDFMDNFHMAYYTLVWECEEGQLSVCVSCSFIMEKDESTAELHAETQKMEIGSAQYAPSNLKDYGKYKTSELPSLM